MKETAIAEMLMNCSIEDANITITVCDQNGTETEIVLLKPDDLINEVVEAGETIELVFSNMKIFKGIFDSVEDEDGELVIYIRSIVGTSYLIGLPFDKLIGYYKDNENDA